jgi:hypothetical protein
MWLSSPLATIPTRSGEPLVKYFGSYPDVETALPDGELGLKKAIWLN